MVADFLVVELFILRDDVERSAFDFRYAAISSVGTSYCSLDYTKVPPAGTPFRQVPVPVA